LSPFTLAAAQFPVDAPASWGEWEERLAQWTAEAAAREARLLVFPEYAGLLLTALLPAEARQSLASQLDGMHAHREAYVAVHQRLARRYGVYLLAGSLPWRLDSGAVVNRAWFHAPDGGLSYHDKRIMTRFEREDWHVAAARGPLRVFDTALGRIGVNLCYDVEFPLLARAQCEAGATLILAPSCTDTQAGYQRVRIGAQARALENQCVAVQSPLVGVAPWSAAIDVNIGAAGVYGPPDRGFPDDGVLALGELNAPGWIYAVFEPDSVATVREQGAVFNHRHWAEQVPATPSADRHCPPAAAISADIRLPPVEIVRL